MRSLCWLALGALRAAVQAGCACRMFGSGAQPQLAGLPMLPRLHPNAVLATAPLQPPSFWRGLVACFWAPCTGSGGCCPRKLLKETTVQRVSPYSPESYGLTAAFSPANDD